MRVLSSGLLLGTAASLALTSGAVAADLPMKAKAPAVQYVKICSLYGAGFYYIPGTDTCLKIGGHLRIDMHWGPTAAPFESVDFNTNNDAPSAIYFNTKTRAYATFDARAQTDYGTLRSYFITGINIDNQAAATAYTFRAFIQLAGFTWGLTDSIFDAYSITPIHLNIVAATNGSIGATGVWQWRYTAELGGGLSASIAIEDPRRRDGAVFGTAHAGDEWPDLLGQLQASGAWGRVSAAVAVRDATIITGPTSTTSDIGWAAMIGGLLRVPGMPGDTFGFQVSYAEGAVRYLTGNVNTGAGGIFSLGNDGKNAQGIVADGYLTPAGIYNLSKGWSIEAGYEHAWSKTLKSSIAGGYVAIDYPGNAASGFCVRGICDTRVWNVGSRTEWSPVPNFSLALDVLYTHVDDFGAAGVAPYIGQVRGDVDVWTAMVRVRRDFWP
jgi:hypothetical protein